MPDTAMPFDRVLISGASGAIGLAMTAELCRRYPGAEIHCIFRRESSLTRFRQGSPSDVASRVTPVIASLTEENALRDALGRFAMAGRVLGVHCAGDVSWTKSERVIAPLNVEGSARFADALVSTSRQRPRLVYFSTAFADELAPPRNDYEKTKLDAERMLADRFGQAADVAILRCSLVVGSSIDGEISRFNGLYPLIRLVALAEVPCVIADRRYEVDIVPIDYVVRMAADCADRQGPALGVETAILAAGGSQPLGIGDLVARVVHRRNLFRARFERSMLPNVSVISRRQYDFLNRAADSWNQGRRFNKIRDIVGLMAGYVTHGETGRQIAPRGVSVPPPDPATYIDWIIDYWLEAHAHKVLAAEHPDWLAEEV